MLALSRVQIEPQTICVHQNQCTGRSGRAPNRVCALCTTYRPSPSAGLVHACYTQHWTGHVHCMQPPLDKCFTWCPTELKAVSHWTSCARWLWHGPNQTSPRASTQGQSSVHSRPTSCANLMTDPPVPGQSKTHGPDDTKLCKLYF